MANKGLSRINDDSTPAVPLATQRNSRKRHATAPASVTQPSDVGRLRVHRTDHSPICSPPRKERRLLTDNRGIDKDGSFDIFAAAFDDLVADPDPSVPIDIDRFFGAIIDRSKQVWHEKYRGMQDELCFLKNVTNRLLDHMEKFVDNFYWMQTAQQLQQDRSLQSLEDQPANETRQPSQLPDDTLKEAHVLADTPCKECSRRRSSASPRRTKLAAKAPRPRIERYDSCNERDPEKILQQAEESSIAAATAALDAKAVAATAGQKTGENLRCELLAILQEELKRRLEPLDAALRTQQIMKASDRGKRLADARPHADHEAKAAHADAALDSAKSALRSFLFRALTNAVDAKTKSVTESLDHSGKSSSRIADRKASSAISGAENCGSQETSARSRQDSEKMAENTHCFTIASDDMGVEAICVSKTRPRQLQDPAEDSNREEVEESSKSASRCSSGKGNKNCKERQEIDERTSMRSNCSMDISECNRTRASERKAGSCTTVTGKESIPEWDPIFTTPLLLTPGASQMAMVSKASPDGKAQQSMDVPSTSPAKTSSSKALSVAASEGYSSLFSTDTGIARMLNTSVQNLDGNFDDQNDQSNIMFDASAYRDAAARSMKYIYKNNQNWHTRDDSLCEGCSKSHDARSELNNESESIYPRKESDNDASHDQMSDIDEVSDSDDDSSDSGEEDSARSDPPLDEAFQALQEALGSEQPTSDGSPIAFVLYELDPAWGKEEIDKIIQAIRRFREETLLSFYPRSTHPECSDLPYLLIRKGELCSSMVGYKKEAAEAGSPTVVMSPNCLKPETATHELVHAVAFYHEEAKTDPKMDLIQIGYPEKECDRSV